MADGNFKINKGITLNPQSSIPTNPVNGDMYYSSSAGTFIMYDNGFWINIASRSDVPSATTLNSAEFTAAVVQNPFVRITGSTVSNLYGLTASTDGKQVIVYNQSAAVCTIKYNNAGEPTAANRILTMTGADVSLLSGMMAMFVYDDSQELWICDTFAGPSSQTDTYPDYYVTDESDLATAITGATSGGGGVICLLNPFTISSSHTIPPDTVLIGRKGASAITVNSGGNITMDSYTHMKDVYFTTTLLAGTIVTLSNTRSIVEGCKMTVPNSGATTICISVTGNDNLIKDSVFIGVAGGSTSTGILYLSGTNNLDSNCLFQS